MPLKLRPMERWCMNFWFLATNSLSWILLSFMASCSKSTTLPSNAAAYQADDLALLDFKNKISEDPFQVMNLWNDSLHFCNWTGVTCSPSNGRVVNLNLQSQKLVGSIPPSIGNLTFLTGINLLNNSLHGELPQELGRLQHLQHLNLSNNSFSGMIPPNLSHCTDLRTIRLAYNNIIGSIPDQLNSLVRLVVLNLGANSLRGRIPAWFGNFSSLSTLFLGKNNLHGRIPREIGRLLSLKVLHLPENKLSGTIPASVFNLTSISLFSVAMNMLHGQCPQDIGLTLPNVEQLYMGMNNFSGSLPLSLPNASRLWGIGFSLNAFTGGVPTNLGSLQSLSTLTIAGNLLGDGKVDNLNFLTPLTNCTSLVKLGLGGNNFGGKLPLSIVNLSSNLLVFTLGDNSIHGTIPVEIANLINLGTLGLEVNHLTGSVPNSIRKLQKLGLLNLFGNKLSGRIPSSFGNLTSLIEIYMDDNRLEGSIPPSLGNCRSLLAMAFSWNNLTGTIPAQLASLSSLSILLALDHNSFSGSIPSEVGSFVNLKLLDLSYNKLSGEIPSTLGRCQILEFLQIEGNMLQGPIPKSLETLRGLVEIDLSNNNLSGPLPKFLGKLSGLKMINLSFNNFEGQVPKEGIFANATAVSVLGNNKLCGGVQSLKLPECSQAKSHSSRKVLSLKVVVPVTISIVLSILLCAFVAFCIIRNSKRRNLAPPPTKDWHLGVSYAEVFKSTNGFSSNNFIGSGSFGSVYRGVCSINGPIVAIKVLNLQHQGASKSFLAECNVLRSIRHRNLLKIITVCSSIDHQGNDFKCLVFEFMSNGSLEEFLHCREGQQHRATSLGIVQRLNIAIDVASALDYLHHQCQIPIVHCDIKPSNILLDDDMTAHVGDLGLARFLHETSNASSKNESISEALKGSIGYIPPEYGMGGQVSVLGDVYSFGILLLELFTGKRPTDEIFKDGLSIHEFVAASLPVHVMDIVDQALLLTEEAKFGDENEEGRRIIAPHHGSGCSLKECLVSFMKIGLSCSNLLPSNRMEMNAALSQIIAVRDTFLGLRRRQ